MAQKLLDMKKKEPPLISGVQKESTASFLNKTGAFISDIFGKLSVILKPDPVVWTGAGWGLVGIAIILLIIMAATMFKSLGVPVTVFIFLCILGISILAATTLHYGLKLINLIPAFYRFMLFVTVVTLLIFWKGNTKARITLIIYTVLTGSILGGVAAVLLIRKWIDMGRFKRVLNLVFVIIGTGALTFGFTWIFLGGIKSDPPDNAALMSDYRPAHMALQDPSMKGECTVLQLTYGSGNDKHRRAFAENVTIPTDAVDGSPFVSNWEKLHGWARTRYWGFDDKALPLNARVCYPDGNGPFPLVLMVHGNHGARDFSDPGYEYLGRLMASRGFIFVSVDENFLNSDWYDIVDHLRTENDCRAWLLLKHLELWRAWNRDTESPFYGKVDMDNIGLVGHSRGGEAVAIATCFNRLPNHPDDATLPFNFYFNLQSVIAIAPVDGQYRPAGTGTTLENVSYFVIQGSNDMDLRSYEGIRQFQRTEFKDTAHHVKAGLYVFGANHGQFNTIWGRNDNTFPYMALFNKRQIMPGEEQEKIGQVYISAFLEATLNGKTGYFNLFRDYRTGIKWLPETVYLSQYEDPACKFICTFEEDINVRSTTLKGGEIQSENLTVWKEQVVPLKQGTQATRAVYVGWNTQETNSLPGVLQIRQQGENQIRTDSHSYLYFVMADAGEDPARKRYAARRVAGDGKRGPIDLTIVLVDSAGQDAALPLSAYSYLPRQLEPKIMKADFMTDIAKSDMLFQVFFFPLSTFKRNNSMLDINCIQEIRYVFDRTEEGVVAIDNIGFWKDCISAAF